MLRKSARVELSGLILFLILLTGFIAACPSWLYSEEGEPPSAPPPEKGPDAEIEALPTAEPGATDPPPGNPDVETEAPQVPKKPVPASPQVPAEGQKPPADLPAETKPGASIKAVFSGYELSLANVPIWLVAVLAFVIIGLFTAAFAIGRKAVSKTTAIFGSVSVACVAALAIALFGIIMYQWGYSSGIEAVNVLIERRTSTAPEPRPTAVMGSGSSGAAIPDDSPSGSTGGGVDGSDDSGFSSSSFWESSITPDDTSKTERLTTWERSIVESVISLIKFYITYRILLLMINVIYPYFQHISGLVRDFWLRRKTP